MSEMAIWEVFETEVLDDLEVGYWFTNRSLAGWLGITPAEASAYIANYLQAQRRMNSRTKYLLQREERTSNAVWTIGMRTTDARHRVGQFGDDMKNTIRRALHPDLVRIGKLNPRARKAIETNLEPIIDGLVTMLNGVLGSMGWDDSDE